VFDSDNKYSIEKGERKKRGIHLGLEEKNEDNSHGIGGMRKEAGQSS
jgi:hypothetical protein